MNQLREMEETLQRPPISPAIDWHQEYIAGRRSPEVMAARHVRESQEEVALLESRRRSLQEELAHLNMHLHDARLRHVNAVQRYQKVCQEQ